MSKTLPVRSSYPQLLAAVRNTLIEAQNRMEAERVKVYLETGRLINLYILKNKERPDRGAAVFMRLSRDLNIHVRVLQRCVRFARLYPPSSVSAQRHFNWSHYRQLITVSNSQQRLLLERAAIRNAWTADELGLRIKEHIGPMVGSNSGSKAAYQFLKPSRGELFTYQLVERPTLGEAESGLLVDLGFGIFHVVDSSLLSQFSKGDIVESRPKDDAYKFYKTTNLTAKSLYTYQAYVEKVIDADTIKVRLDLGFNIWIRQILRLRDLNAPEVTTKEGEEAKNFVQLHVKESSLIVVRSSRSDKYDRYLADIFIPQGRESDPKTDLYLNNLLLEKGYAVRWGNY